MSFAVLFAIVLLISSVMSIFNSVQYGKKHNANTTYFMIDAFINLISASVILLTNRFGGEKLSMVVFLVSLSLISGYNSLVEILSTKRCTEPVHARVISDHTIRRRTSIDFITHKTVKLTVLYSYNGIDYVAQSFQELDKNEYEYNISGLGMYDAFVDPDRPYRVIFKKGIRLFAYVEILISVAALALAAYMLAGGNMSL